MAYEYKKLSEVDIVNTVDSETNLFVEQGNDIKRLNIESLPISSGQVQADWNEADETSLAFIKNKPDLSNIGSGSSSDSGSKTTFIIPTASSFAGFTFEDGTNVTAEKLKNALEKGTVIIKYEHSFVYSGGMGKDEYTELYPILSSNYTASYMPASGGPVTSGGGYNLYLSNEELTIWYIKDGAISSKTIY